MTITNDLTPPSSPSSMPPMSTPRSSSPPPPIGEVPTRTAAIVAGVGYVALFALAIFANFFVREGLIVTDDAAATAANIVESEGLFRLGMVAFAIIFLLDVVVAWALHLVFRPASPDLSLVAAWSRIVYTVFLGVALIFFFQALQLLGGADFLDTFSPEQLDAQALIALDTFNSTWLIGLSAFGLHLLILGGVVLRTRLAPRALGVILLVAGAAYVIDTAAHIILADYADYETAITTMVIVPAVLAEGWFGLWLLLRAGRNPA